MNTQPTQSADSAHPTAHVESTQTFDRSIAALAGVLFMTVASAAGVLMTLPEALDAVAGPAFTAPWPSASAAADVATVNHREEALAGFAPATEKADELQAPLTPSLFFRGCHDRFC